MQIVYISNRKDIARETLEYVENLMPFVTEAIFVCPGTQVKDFRFKSRISVRAVNEASALGKDFPLFKRSRNHQFRNCLLRFSLARMKDVSDEFIMSDDDNRPLMEIPLSFYKTDDRYDGYYCYNLKRWRSRETDYDRGQHETCRILERKGFGTLSYSSHMPQLIQKRLLGETAQVFRDSLDRGAQLDEWSAYFNYGQTAHPDRFNRPKPFKTLCWPPFPSDWPLDVRPHEFCFENFYPVLYRKGMIFSGLPTRFDNRRHLEISKEKIKRRVAFQNEYEAGQISLAGRFFLLCRDLGCQFPTLKRAINDRLSPSLRTSLLQFFMGRFPDDK